MATMRRQLAQRPSRVSAKNHPEHPQVLQRMKMLADPCE